MHIVITGANGFIGNHLARRILSKKNIPEPLSSFQHLTLVDLDFSNSSGLEEANLVAGSFADPKTIQTILKTHPADFVFHLASVPSGLAEENFQLGVDVNILGTQALFDSLKNQGNCPTVVFASSIAVYGKPEVDTVDEKTLPKPDLSYGAQKVIGETLLADYNRRQWLRGSSVRIPGIVARPSEPNGAVSFFFSDLIRKLSAGKPFTCPVSAEGKSWLMSVHTCVNNLLNAACLQNQASSTWTLPALHIRIGDLVEAIANLYPEYNISELINYQPDEWVEYNFATYPPLHCPNAQAHGFTHDGDLKSLVVNALN